MSRSKQRRRAPSPRPPSSNPPAVSRPPRSAPLVVAVLLAIATTAVYVPVRQFEFVQVDDPAYVTENPMVARGLTLDGIAWALTATHSANWHPLTWISHMADVELFGMNAGAHHLMNLAMHVASTLLLFGWLQRATGFTWRSGFVAALFALHPLHVESVAWVAERKDVLSTLLLMLTLWAYARHARGGAGGYALMTGLLALGLMAKPMLVTTPFLLLLLDYWPMRRARAPFSAAAWRPLVVEKLPLIALVAISSAITFVAQQRGGAVAELTTVPVALRVQNAVVAYVRYLVKTVWPVDLTMLYPLPDAIPIWQVAGAIVLLAAVTAIVIRAAADRPYLPVGWFWYVGTLVPVIGIVQVGVQAIADRYTYIPLIGIFVIVAWGVPELIARFETSLRRAAIAVPAIATLLVCAGLTSAQLEYWRNSVSLWQRALTVTLGADQFDAHMALGHTLAPQGRTTEAVEHFAAAARLRPESADAHHRLGMALVQAGRLDEAMAAFSTTIRLDPQRAAAHADLGRAKVSRGDHAGAIPHLTDAVRLDPSQAEPQSDLGYLLTLADRVDEALPYLTAAVRIRPDYAEAHNNLGFAHARAGRFDEALTSFTQAISLKSDYDVARRNRILALAALGRTADAVREARELLRDRPGDRWAGEFLQAAAAGGSPPR
jgi:Flp pilus assembly protein TadD